MPTGNPTPEEPEDNREAIHQSPPIASFTSSTTPFSLSLTVSLMGQDPEKQHPQRSEIEKEDTSGPHDSKLLRQHGVRYPTHHPAQEHEKTGDVATHEHILHPYLSFHTDNNDATKSIELSKIITRSGIQSTGCFKTARTKPYKFWIIYRWVYVK